MQRRRSALTRLVTATAVVLVLGVLLLKVFPLYRYIHKGLDLSGGIQLLYSASGGQGQPYSQQALETTVGVIEYRIDKLGVTNPVVEAEPTAHRILVQIPGISNLQQAESIIGATDTLDFGSLTDPVVTGSELKSAVVQPVTGSTGGAVQSEILLTFNSKGTAALASYTGANVGKTMAIYLNKSELMNPTVEEKITNGQAVLTGGFTTAEAQALAIELNSGALPLSLKVISNSAVSATLGAQSIQQSKVAAVLALVLVVAFMFLVYRVPGFWAAIALLVYALGLMAVLIALHATLTLPGVTGMILSIGMAVDSNVIIYERIKEELRGGRALRAAVDEGFHHGLRAILDSNATTVIASAVLYEMGSSLIRGFAVTVGLGVIISLLTAVVFTRYLLHWFVDTGVRPSFWVFAPRAEIAVAGGGSVALGSVVARASVAAPRPTKVVSPPEPSPAIEEPTPVERPSVAETAAVSPDTPFQGTRAPADRSRAGGSTKKKNRNKGKGKPGSRGHRQ